MSHRSDFDKKSSGPEVAELLKWYRWATQDPATQAAVLAQIYRQIRPGCEAVALREDFSGSAADSVAWVAAAPNRRALAVDIDADTITYARRRAARLIGGHAKRITFVEGDVHAVTVPEAERADVVSVLNFSSFYFHERAALLRYFISARESLNQHGMLVLNVFGGPGAMQPRLDRHLIVPKLERGQAEALPPFDYLWEQLGYDACSARIDCRIHFEIADGTSADGRRLVRDAFRYDWRLWTLPELTELLRAAGFADAQVWRHTATTTGADPEVFLGPVDSLRDLDLWLAYVVAIR